MKLLAITKHMNQQLANRPITFNGDGFLTVHNCDFLNEPEFQEAMNRGKSFAPENRDLIGAAWRAHFCCWAANQALHLDGDFVECGVNYGFLSRTVCEYVSFETQNRSFYLFDKWDDPHIHMAAMRRFEKYPNVHLIRGSVPDSLGWFQIPKVAYLSIDMNGVAGERGAIDYFYPRMVKGGVIYLDDYGWSRYKEQKQMFDRFFEDKPEAIFQLPSGQGIVIKL